MSLRTRLALTTVAVAIPLLAVLHFFGFRPHPPGPRPMSSMPFRPVGGAPHGHHGDFDLRPPHPPPPRAPFPPPHRFGPGPPSRPPGPPPFLPPVHVWLAPLGIALVAILVATGPVVRRIRRLTEAVQRSSFADGDRTGLPAGGDELGNLAQAFDAAASRMRAHYADEARGEESLRDVLACTMHDVMTPLTVLQGHLVSLHTGDGGSTGALRSAIDEAHYVGAVLRNLEVAACLDGRSRPEHAPVDLVELVERVVARHAPIASQLGVSLASGSSPEPIRAHADATLLEQAVSNLVLNAVRHNRPGGNAAALVETIDGARFRVRVFDDGPGMSAAAENRARPEDDARAGQLQSSRVSTGRGLGLRIAARVARVHGYDLRLADAPGGGVSAELSGPLWIDVAPRAETAAVSSP